MNYVIRYKNDEPCHVWKTLPMTISWTRNDEGLDIDEFANMLEQLQAIAYGYADPICPFLVEEKTYSVNLNDPNLQST